MMNRRRNGDPIQVSKLQRQQRPHYERGGLDDVDKVSFYTENGVSVSTVVRGDQEDRWEWQKNPESENGRDEYHWTQVDEDEIDLQRALDAADTFEPAA